MSDLQQISFDKFNAGFVSELDIDTLKSPRNAVSDIMNCEINNPLYKITNCKGIGLRDSIPDNSGNRNVDFYNWKVKYPSEQEITILIRSSGNFMKFSQDTEGGDGDVWIKNNQGGTITYNDTYNPSIVGYLDRYTFPFDAADDSSIKQSISNYSLLKGKTVILSFYEKCYNTYSGQFFTVKIDDGVSPTTYNFNADTGGSIIRTNTSPYNVSNSATKLEITITFPSFTQGKDFDVAIGAFQLEIGSTPTGYGRTFRVQCPYYIYMKPYWFNGGWVNSWLNLTEQEYGKLTYIDATHETIAIGYNPSDPRGDGYFVNFFSNYDPNNGSASIYGGGVIAGYTASTNNFVCNTYNGSDNVLISRSNFDIKDRQFSSLVGDSSSVSFNDYGGDLRISIYGCYPLIISYVKNSYNFTPSSLNISFDGFTCDYSQRDYVEMFLSGVGPLGLSSNASTSNVALFSGLSYGSGPGGLLDPSKYYSIILVMEYNTGQKLFSSPYNTGGGYPTIFILPYIFYSYFSFRIKAIHCYVKEGNLGDDIYDSSTYYYQFTINITDTGIGFHSFPEGYDGEKIFLGKPIEFAAFNNNTSSLIADIPRKVNISTMSIYRAFTYSRGHAYYFGVPENGLFVKISFLRGVVEEIDTLAFSKDDGYGYLQIEGGNDVTGIMTLIDNSFVVCSSNTTFVYDNSSGAFSIRILYRFIGIGCSNFKSIAQYNGVNYWCDTNGIYAYSGGITPPQDISNIGIKRYWQSFLSPDDGHHFSTELNSCFGVININLSEYWLLIKTTNSGSYTDFTILRYSLLNNNFNKLRTTQIPVALRTQSEDNGVSFLGYDDGSGATAQIYYYGGFTYQLPSPYIKTHKVPVGNSNRINIEEIYAEYDCSANLSRWNFPTQMVISLILDDEGVGRTGNVKTFVSALKFDKRGARLGSQCRKFSFYITLGNGNSDFNVSDIGITYRQIMVSYGERK